MYTCHYLCVWTVTFELSAFQPGCHHAGYLDIIYFMFKGQVHWHCIHVHKMKMLILSKGFIVELVVHSDIAQTLIAQKRLLLLTHFV